MTLVFWSCAVLICYVYLGYPVLLISGFLGRRRPIRQGHYLPSVSILVPAHNEDVVIDQKLENLLALEYPRDRLEILVGSDGSTDDTEDIVRRFSGDGVRLVSSASQRGKSSIQNDLVATSSGSILVFTDADCRLAGNALCLLVHNFADPDVGLVTIRTSYSGSQETDVAKNESLYWRYENRLRQEESDRRVLAVATGWLFALRRSLWKPLDPNVGDDFILPLQVALQGYRNVLDPAVVVRSELAHARAGAMFRMKMRIVSKDLRGLWLNRAALNPMRAGGAAISLWSHKLLRWLVPYFLVGLFLANLPLLNHTMFRIGLALQVVFYGLAAAGILLGERRAVSPWSIPMSFCLVNIAALLGTVHCASGRTVGLWRPLRSRPSNLS